MRRELSILDAARVVLSISRTEHTVFEMLLQSSKINYLPPNNKPQNEPEPSKAKKIDLLFLGSGNYKNVRGINGFLEMYRTWKLKPTLAIAGTVSSHVQVDPVSDSSVSVMGHVKSLPSLYEGVRAAICPVEGTGVNIKILEALAYGKPSFATRAAIAALPQGSEECVFPLTETCIREMLTDPDKMRAASAAALKYVDSPHIRNLWADFGQALGDLFNGV
jgi:glycosyltransferase involved in cell wall biosynthesis